MIDRRAFWALDVLALVAAFLVTFALVPVLRHLFLPGGLLNVFLSPISLRPWIGEVPPVTDLAWIPLVIGCVGLLTLGAMGGHRPLLEQSIVRIVFSSLGAPLVGLSLVTLILFALKNPDWSRLFVFTFALASAGTLGVYRLLLKGYHAERRRRGFYTRNVLVVGGPSATTAVVRQFETSRAHGTDRLVGYLELPNVESAYPPHLACLGCVDELGRLLQRTPIDQVVAVDSPDLAEWLARVASDCDEAGVPLSVTSEVLLELDLLKLRVTYDAASSSFPCLLLAPAGRPGYEVAKRALDIALSGLALLLMSPILVLIALLIKLDSRGPVLHRYDMVGKSGRIFRGQKFRSMVVDAHDLLPDLEHLNEMSGPVFKAERDPRVTRVGRWLRKFSLDEVPQLFSVLKGDMSLVGPRPPGPYEAEKFEDWHWGKLKVKPGMTSLWIVNGKPHSFDQWVKMDLEYIERSSLWFDVSILLRTLPVVLLGQNK